MRIVTRFLCVLLYLSCTPSTPTPPEHSSEDGIAYDSSLTSRYLLDSGKSIESPRVVIGHYDASRGLLTAFQSKTGKRILFRVRVRPGGGLVAQILHHDPATGKIAHLVGKSRRVDEHGQPVRDIEIAGVDMRWLMSSGSPDSAGRADREAHLKRFVASDTGQALLDGVPALYAALDSAEQGPEAARLLAPLGAVAMALQLATKQFRGFEHAEAILGPARAKSLRDACKGEDDCLFRGRHFMVHRSSGLFNVLSDRPGLSVEKSSSGVSSLAGGSCAPETMEGSCFGLCGPGCITPGDIAATECYGHDYCVCAYGHADCLTSVPDYCGLGQGVACYSLWQAVGGYLGGLWDSFWNWVDEWFEDVPDDSTEP